MHLQYYCQFIHSHNVSINSLKKNASCLVMSNNNKIFFLLLGNAWHIIISSVMIDNCTTDPRTSSPPKVKIKKSGHRNERNLFVNTAHLAEPRCSCRSLITTGKKGRPFWSNWWRMRLSASICVVCSLLSG